MSKKLVSKRIVAKVVLQHALLVGGMAAIATAVTDLVKLGIALDKDEVGEQETND